MTTKSAYIFAFILVLASVLVGIHFYPQLPAQVASHWNASGVANGYSSKFWRVFLFPIITVVIFLLIMLIPSLDPLHGNIQQFRKQYNLFAVALAVFFTFIGALSLAWNLGERFNFGAAIAPGVGLLFFLLGTIMRDVKQNWFFGIRTPWTLSSESVWRETHRVGSWLFQAAGLIACLGIVFPSIAIWLVLLPILLTAISTVVYSYVVYRREAHS
jgi:uncharacterized membrane protein